MIYNPQENYFYYHQFYGAVNTNAMQNVRAIFKVSNG